MIRIALDAMGGDKAPQETVAGAIEAAQTGVQVLLVGDQAALGPLADGSGLEIVHASEVIDMHEDPARAIREKKDASVSIAARLVADGSADGFVSAGSTGAALAAAAFVVGRLEGVGRPAIASVFPAIAGGVVVIDVGANIEVKPENLAQFAVMGAAVATTYLGKTAPRVALLNVGEEETKGRDLEKAAFGLLTKGPTNFVGNVEGRDIAAHVADVIVTDGFTGNILLKTAEGAARFTGAALASELLADDVLLDVRSHLTAAITRLTERLDPEYYGGAHLVGSKGVVVIAHGSSSRVAIANALEMAAEGARQGLVQRVVDGLQG
ncbi:MAG: phosphate acyltransferase PlsX [Acidimicrobiia bacterium]|nr:phosphate acyltransferase PlsX [Acidimicrobiia bacterium]